MRYSKALQIISSVATLNGGIVFCTCTAYWFMLQRLRRSLEWRIQCDKCPPNLLNKVEVLLPLTLETTLRKSLCM
jgi:hypothetical protein